MTMRAVAIALVVGDRTATESGSPMGTKSSGPAPQSGHEEGSSAPSCSYPQMTHRQRFVPLPMKTSVQDS